MMCCGVQEIKGINYEGVTPKKIVRDVCDLRYYHCFQCAFYIFTDKYSNQRNGDALMKYIHDNNLGEVTKSHSARNPNSYNIVTVYIWKVHEPNLWQYCLDMKEIAPTENARLFRERYKKYDHEYTKDVSYPIFSKISNYIKNIM